jgi:hypothetical protein
MNAIRILALVLAFLATMLLAARADAQGAMPGGSHVDVLAVGLGSVEDFTFDAGGDLLVGSVNGDITRVSFDETTPLPIDGSALSPEVTGNHAVYGLAFDGSGDLWLSEWDNHEITKLDYPLPVVPYDASGESPMATLNVPDGVSFAPPGSPFGTDLYVGDIAASAVWTVAADGTAAVFSDVGHDIEGVAFGPAGDVLYAWSPGDGSIWALQPGGTATEVASGFAFPDAAAQGPGNGFGDYVYVGDLTGNTLYRVDPDTGATTVFGIFTPDFYGFEDILFGPDGNMYILAFGRGGQILRVGPPPSVGGILEMQVDGSALAVDVAADSADGSSLGYYIALATGMAAAVIVVAAGAWYARRQLSR